MNKSNNVHFYYIIIFSFITIAIIQLFIHQIINGKKYEEISRKNYIRIKRINPARGMILDEKLRPLASNTSSINLYITPFLIDKRENLINFLVENLPITTNYIEKLLYDNRFRAYEDILVYENFTEETLARIAEKMNYFPELSLKTEVLRQYSIPNHFTGYIAKINEQEFKRLRNEDYTINSKIGKAGIEKYYEGLLAGKSGFEIVQVDAVGRNLNLFKQDLNQSPINGFHLVLTINLQLQEYIQSVFPRDKAGAVVIMNCKTGGILAYNSFPEYDQNWFTEGISNAQWEFLRDHDMKPLLDRVTMGTYPPGSTFKVVSAAFGLEKNYITEFTRLASCQGGMQIGDRYFRCWLHSGHGRSNILEGMALSCDVFFYDLSARFNLDEFADFTKNSLIIERTGVDLPSEREGFFPKIDWYRQRLGRFLATTGIRANLVIGQGEVLTSPLAVCAHYAAIANNGLWKTPHFLNRAFNEFNNIEYNFFPHQNQSLPYSPQTLDLIQKGLYEAVHRYNGTARFTKIKGAEIYAKTGSSENPHGSLTHASVAGYGKWNGEPEIAFYMIVENAGSGGSVAGPLMGKILQFYHENIR